MGIWAGIKYALNSTLGTNYFQSLNSMMTKELYYSDEVYETIESGSKVLGELATRILERSLLMKTSGSGYIKVAHTYYDESDPISYKGKITVIATKPNGEQQIINSKNIAGQGTASIGISFNAGDIISVKVENTWIDAEGEYPANNWFKITEVTFNAVERDWKKVAKVQTPSNIG